MPVVAGCIEGRVFRFGLDVSITERPPSSTGTLFAIPATSAPSAVSTCSVTRARSNLEWPGPFRPWLWPVPRTFVSSVRLLYAESMSLEILRRLDEVVWVDPDRLSGAPCFRGTRIPVQMLIDHLAAGFSLDEFLVTVPSLERSQAQRFLELAGDYMNECASSLTKA
jgi:uncharacterized protein (DUF433 family)